MDFVHGRHFRFSGLPMQISSWLLRVFQAAGLAWVDSVTLVGGHLNISFSGFSSAFSCPQISQQRNKSKSSLYIAAIIAVRNYLQDRRQTVLDAYFHISVCLCDAGRPISSLLAKPTQCWHYWHLHLPLNYVLASFHFSTSALPSRQINLNKILTCWAFALETAIATLYPPISMAWNKLIVRVYFGQMRVDKKDCLHTIHVARLVKVHIFKNLASRCWVNTS